jgi:hypothetical protein
MQEQSTDTAAIVAAATDYIESWIDGDADRMARCLHPALAKRAIEDPDGRGLDLDEAPYSDMVAAAGQRQRPEVGRDYGLDVLDVFDGIAAVKVLSRPYMDYLHLARFGDRWLIVNVLYARR